MDGSATGEIETSHDERPTSRIPCPVSNGVVNDGGPDEHEDDARKHAGAVDSGTNGQSRASFSVSIYVDTQTAERISSLRDSSKHSLEETKENIRDLGATDRGGGEDVLEAKVVEVADERVVSGVCEGQTVTPKEPLKHDQGYRHHRQPDQREGRLAAGKTRVEESDTGNHEKHECRRGHDPGKVATL